jgi:hypothetical protein
LGGFRERSISPRSLFGGSFGFAGVALGILAAEALHAAGCVHKLLLAGKERVAGGANLYADVAFVGGAGNKCISAGTVHADFAIVWMDRCFHDSS